MPAPSRSRFHPASWMPSRSMWWAVLAAAAVGILLFTLIWIRARGEPDFYRSGEVPATAAAPGADYTPLPVPAGDGSGETGGMDPGKAPASDDGAAILETETARIIEAPPPPAPVQAPFEPATANAPVTQPMPLSGRTPAPRYPARALRRGESGTVMVQARIGVDGVPQTVTVARGSGSRDLDRAAVEAVRQWRFQPATRDGQPTTGVVNVPIEFNRGG